MFRATPGELPLDAATEIGGIDLPTGRQITADGAEVASAWVTTSILPVAQLTELIHRFVEAFERTGLWPVQVVGLSGGLERPWLDGEFRGPDDRTIDAVSIFDGSWRAALYPDLDFSADDESLSPAPFHTMADAVDGADLTAADIVVDQPAALLLVPVDRPANVPKVLGWFGATNLDLVGEPVSTVLRSWEDRFGATLVAMSYDTITLQVPRAPQSGEQVERLVAEHYAFCPDNIDQGMEAEDYAEFLPDWEGWAFWWD
ncbi:hypothetical protein GOEFS_032_00280 [Gordonia effusa NBRC 100432]|uniref:DUF4253 domain-containing protein n=1 Tax=Gordonia effusa NBRC 100432 TaxID=1077974 RepID=H0QX81_9ACTN|nr:DUF4253 domain-containing protein [Gordonia effusa]GAB17432.1 hypothetical protein GOEFS_032_00280 [Gordonia effusa NBRC 100432]